MTRAELTAREYFSGKGITPEDWEIKELAHTFESYGREIHEKACVDMAKSCQFEALTHVAGITKMESLKIVNAPKPEFIP